MEEEKKLPKNIRQMAEKEERVRVYLEDYAYTFIHKLNCDERVRTGVLLGNRMIAENKRCWFVKGAVELEDVPENEQARDEAQACNLDDAETGQETANPTETEQVDETHRNPKNKTITQQIWNNTLAVIQEYFPGCSICGWFICGSEENFPDGEQLKKTHRQIFAGENCLMYWKQGDEDSFWVEEDETILHLKGYFVYYEKNEEMQNYMLSHREEQHEDVSDQAALNFRKIMKEKQDEKHPVQKMPRRQLWMRTGMAAAFLLLVGGGVLLSRSFQKNEEDSVVALAVGASVERQSGEVEKSSFASEETQNESADAIENGNGAAEMVKAGSTESAGQAEGAQAQTKDQTKEEIENMTQDPAQDSANSAQNSAQDSTQDSAAGINAQSDADKKDVAALPESGIFSGNMMFYKDGLGASVYRVTGKNESTASTEAQENEQEILTVEFPTVAAGEDENTNTTASAEEAAVNRPAAYTVQPGDTLIEISKRFYGSSQMVMQIKEANGLDDINKIYIGQELTLP